MKRVNCVLFCLFFLILGFKPPVFAKEVLSLKDLILSGLKNNPQIQIAVKSKEQYVFQKDYVRSSFFPFLYLKYEFDRTDPGKGLPNREVHAFGPYLNWNVFSGFSTWHSYQETLKLISAQDFAVKRTILDVSLNIIRAYLEYFKQKALYEAALSDLEDAKILLKLAKKKYEVGLSPYADVLDAEAKVKQAEFNVTNYKYTADIAKAQVLTLINYDITRIEEIEFLPLQEEDLEVKDFNFYLKTAIEKRPELKAKESEVFAQEERVKSVKGKFWPSIDLFSSYYQVDDKFFPDKNNEFVAGFRVTFPIFTGFQRLAELNKEKVGLEQKRLEKANIELQIKQEVFTSYKNYQTTKESFESALVWLKSMEEDYRVVQKKYETGLASIVDVTTLLARLSEVRSKVAISKYNLIYSFYELYRMSGTIPELDL
ncbi:TolC family protein [Thermodesulfobacterium sp. TA1]|uniref:TolC family protein n=1 Tax=Thermodesulfobacterium sp. TA1 TaxID=2234087 RepID=UPI0012319F0E|nr:TolC family protein [Thermodesulfobacterium sp. TA1]QER42042.1 TolC family protein [Thermodesulfobacterium sp. TA1]